MSLIHLYKTSRPGKDLDPTVPIMSALIPIDPEHYQDYVGDQIYTR